ncbi:hypothetical protein [Cysteiniphilum sp. JM-1]|uniref:hypothetical protein n=1 Tax=Cysteiniphilum sp. JM-1 TaxID=2610891 RepID=UPI001247BD8E|nr:hypothetical protein [Cysteiniphilum sp. JM-1]
MKNKAIKSLIIGNILFLSVLGSSQAFAGYSSGDWLSMAGNLWKQIQGMITFVQIIATLIGVWFCFHALQLFRKHHTSQGAQGENIKNAIGHAAVGVFLIGLIPMIQMLQSTVMKNAGDGESQKTFQINQGDFDIK